MLHRHLQNALLEQINQNSVLYLNGPRQCGKSTLVHSLKDILDSDYITFDNYADLMRAQNDPESFLQNSTKNLILNEVQLAPEIFRPLKMLIDKQRLEGSKRKIILTGSVDIMTLPALSDALVGRMSLLTLYPLSVSENLSRPKLNLLSLFEDGVQNFSAQSLRWQDAVKLASYPVLSVDSSIDTYPWFDGYITTLLQRDIRQLSNLDKMAEMPKIMNLLSSRIGNLSNDTNVAIESTLSLSSYRRYRSLLEAVFLIHFIEPWHSNLSKRLIKSPKLYFIDTLLLTHIMRKPINTLDASDPYFGHIFENFVFSEILKCISGERIKLYHYRDTNQVEVDFVLENEYGEVVGIEAKTKAYITNKDLKNLKSFKEVCGAKFRRGYVMHSGSESYPLEYGFHALPVSALW